MAKPRNCKGFGLNQAYKGAFNSRLVGRHSAAFADMETAKVGKRCAMPTYGFSPRSGVRAGFKLVVKIDSYIE